MASRNGNSQGGQGGGSGQGSADLGPLAVSDVGLLGAPHQSGHPPPLLISSCRKMRRGGTSKYLPWGRKAPGFPYLLNVLLTIDFFGVPYILSSPSSFLLSCLSRNGYWVIEQLTNTKFQLGVKISSLARTTLSSLLFWPLQFSTCHCSANTGFSPYTLTFSFHFYPIIW